MQAILSIQRHKIAFKDFNWSHKSFHWALFVWIFIVRSFIRFTFSLFLPLVFSAIIPIILSFVCFVLVFFLLCVSGYSSRIICAIGLTKWWKRCTWKCTCSNSTSQIQIMKHGHHIWKSHKQAIKKNQHRQQQTKPKTNAIRIVNRRTKEMENSFVDDVDDDHHSDDDVD